MLSIKTILLNLVGSLVKLSESKYLGRVEHSTMALTVTIF